MPGPYYFAWVDEGTAFNAVTHAVWDDDIFEFEIEHNEGDFPTLRLQVRNPRIGLLAPGRKQWAWFSWFNGTQIVPLFYGRLVSVPEQLQDEIVELNFIARPSNYNAQKLVVANEIKQYNIWDPIWFRPDTRDEPDNALEALPAVWHIDRITHQVSISNIIAGEDGTVAVDEDDAFYDSVKLSYSQNPARSVRMQATVSWDQKVSGLLPQRLRGLPAPAYAASYTAEGLAAAWPTDGQPIGGGWFWNKASFTIVDGLIDPSRVGEWVPNPLPNQNRYVDGGFDTALGVDPVTGIGYAYHIAIPRPRFTYNLELGFDASRRKSEVLSFTMVADVQAIASDPGDEAVVELQLSSSEMVDIGALAPKSRAYFATPRGEQSLIYILAVARAHLLARARAVNVEFEIAFERAVAETLSCRKNAVLTDPRLPGGSAAGKIKAYRIGMSSGHQFAAVTIGCTVGRDGVATEVAGQPDYVDDDYVDPDYQEYIGQYVLLPTGLSDLVYEFIEGREPVDDGVNFDLIERSIRFLGIIPDAAHDTDQQTALTRLFDIQVDASGSITPRNISYSRLFAHLQNLQGGPFETPIALGVSELKVPRNINLEAA